MPGMKKRIRRPAPRKTPAAASDSTAATSEMVSIAAPEDGVGSVKYWNEQIERATKRIDEEVTGWKRHLDLYNGAAHRLPGIRSADNYSVNAQFYTTENKKPQLCYQTPAVLARPEMGADPKAQPVVQALMNQLLSRKGVNLQATMDEVLNDVLITSGIGPTKIGYDCIQVKTQIPTDRMEPDTDPVTLQTKIDPATGQPAMRLALGDDGQPETKEVPKTIWSKYYWDKFSICDLLVPAGFTSSTDYDRAPWLAWKFRLSDAQCEQFGVPKRAGDQRSRARSILNRIDADALEECPEAIEIWYYASYVSDDPTTSPDRVRQLILVPGATAGRGRHATQIITHRNSPYQVFDKDGQFVKGMKGFPIQLLTIRSAPESAWPKSDCAVIEEAAREKSMGRSLQIRQRKRNLPLRGADKSRMSPDTLKQIESGDVQEIILFDGPPTDQLVALDKSAFPSENFEFDREAQQDIDRLSASGPSQQSISTPGSETATESSLQQRASDDRKAKEREILLGGVNAGTEKLFALVQLFAGEKEVQEVVGLDGASQWVQWNKETVQGQWSFTFKPDSARRTDVEQERGMFLRLFNLSVNHPNANGKELLTMLFTEFGQDATKLVKDPNPPQPPIPEAPQQEKPRISISLKGDDLDPTRPGYANVLHLLEMAGMGTAGLSPAAAASGGPQELVKAAQGLPPVDKHDANESGRLPGPGPM